MKTIVPILSFLVFSLLSYSQNTVNMDFQGHRAGPDPGAFLYPSLSPDAGGSWVSVGPFGGDVADMAADPLQLSHVFAAAGTPFESTDDGETWTPMNDLLLEAGGPINSIMSPNLRAEIGGY